MNSDDVRREWAERSGEYSPAYYAYYGPNETSEVIRATLQRHVDQDDPVLELGCSSGRHLSHLRESGFTDLTGVEVNGDALDVMEETYPDLAAEGTFHFDAIEDVVDTFEDDAFAAVYSVETLQHIHPDAEWVFEEVARIAEDVVVTGESEGDRDEPNYVREDIPLYYRDWRRVFTDLGFEEVDATECKRYTVRTFRSRD